MTDLGLITDQSEYDPQIGCNIPADITFTPALDVSDAAAWRGETSNVKNNVFPGWIWTNGLLKPGSLCVSGSAATSPSANHTD